MVSRTTLTGSQLCLERHALPLLVHGEVTRPDCDVFDRESAFIDEVLEPLLARHAGLRVVFEHITTKRAVQFVRDAPGRVAATITPQHLLLDRNALFEGGLRYQFPPRGCSAAYSVVPVHLRGSCA